MHCAPLIWLGVAFSNASASPSCCTSTQHLGLCHSSRIHLLLHSSHLFGCRVAQHLNPYLAATPPGASASASCCSLACDSVWCRLPPLPPPYSSHITSPSPEWEWGLPEHRRFCCRCSVRLSSARGLLHCCRCHGCPCACLPPARGLPPRCPCRARPLPGPGPKERASLSGWCLCSGDTVGVGPKSQLC